jgi:hypothetical protein
MLVLVPRISYEGLKDKVLKHDMETFKDHLLDYYNIYYAGPYSLLKVKQMLLVMSPQALLKKLISPHTMKRQNVEANELKECFKLKQQNFKTTDLIHWWYRHGEIYPNLYCLAHDILAILVFVIFIFGISYLFEFYVLNIYSQEEEM